MNNLLPRRRRSSMRVLSWNVAKRRACAAQGCVIAAAEPDLVVLQELNARTWSQQKEQLAHSGLVHAASALDLAPRRRIAAPAFASFVAIASRWPIHPSARARVPGPEPIVCVSVDSPLGAFDLIGVHIPTYGSADRTLKVRTQEGLLHRLRRRKAPTVLCGDFNSPFAEDADGNVLAFARRRGSRQHVAEAALMGATNSCGLTDLFRARHGYGVEARSWYWKNRGNTGGYRLDHIFASGEFAARACDYIHDWRTQGLSDHSAIYADLVLSNGASPPPFIGNSLAMSPTTASDT